MWGNKIKTNWYIKPPNQDVLHPYSSLHCFYSPVPRTSHQLNITCYLCVVFTNGQGSSKMFEELWMPLRNIQCFYQLHSLPCHPLRSCVVSIQPPWSFLAFGGHAAYCLVSQGLGTVRFTAVTKPNLIIAGHAGLWYPHETGICMERSSMGCTMLNGRAESHQESFSYHFYACNG